MSRRELLLAGLVCMLLLFAAAEASGHGGTYRGPPGGDGSTPGPGGPNSGGPPPGPGTGTGGLPPGLLTFNPPNGNKGPRGSGRARGRKKRVGDEGFEQWHFWWEQNKDGFLELRSRLVSSPGAFGGGRIESGSNGFLNGAGRREVTRRTSQVTAAEAEQKLLPVLRSVLSEDNPEIVDSAVLAMARMTRIDGGAAESVLAEIKAALTSKHASVRQSAVLSLGVLGRFEAVPLLIEVMNDSRRGREALGVSTVQSLSRAFAAFSLGLIGEPRSIRSLCRVIESQPDSEVDVRSAALLALGLFANGRDEVVPFLLEQLNNRQMDRLTRAQIPISLGRLGTAAEPAVPALLKELRSKKSDICVRESCVIALGQLGRLDDEDVLNLLFDTVLEGRQAQERHFALIALAEIGARAAAQDVATASETLNRLSVFLLRQLTDSKRGTHLPWAAISTALLGRELEPGTPTRITMETKLLEAFEGTNNPTHKAGVAVALGLLKVNSAGNSLYKELNESRDSYLRGYLAVSLGMLQFEGAREGMRALLLGNEDPQLRFQVATALGLMADRKAVEALLDTLQDAQTLAEVSSVSTVLGLIGDRSVVNELSTLVTDKGANSMARAFACVAIGLIGEKSSLPWNAPLSTHGNYRTSVSALYEVLDIL